MGGLDRGVVSQVQSGNGGQWRTVDGDETEEKCESDGDPMPVLTSDGSPDRVVYRPPLSHKALLARRSPNWAPQKSDTEYDPLLRPASALL